MAMKSRVFQYYLDNFFKFPKELKNDIVYCQRSLKAHLKVHQMVIDVFEQEENADPAQKQRILDEIESEIYEINAEQHFLFLRVRRIVDEFKKMLNRNDVLIDYEAINSMISKSVVPRINDTTIEILPVSVLYRNTEQKLIEKYFEIQKEKIVYEIEDSDEDTNLISPTNEKMDTEWDINEPKHNVFDVNQTIEGTYSYQGSLGMSSSLSQMSLLKPISQRLIGNFGNVSSEGFPDASKFLQMHLVEEKGSDEPPKDFEVPVEIKDEPVIDFPVSKNVKISRLNLRQALNKARTENMAAKTTANVFGRSIAPTISEVEPKISNEAVIHSAKKYEIRTRSARNASSAVLVENASEINSSSDDSNPEHLPVPQPHKSFSEPGEERTLPLHYGQEMFLRIFQLYTPTVLVQMQQRRSKRKRRTVYNNERADFHYGRIEYGSYPPPEKKRKTFLLSPQVKRVLQSKRPKRVVVEKNETTSLSRSSSSSPDEKRRCNECFKSDDCFDMCSECNGYYHQMCHIEETAEISGHKSDLVSKKNLPKLCPACKRQNASIFNKDELQSVAQELEKKLALEKNRRASLQHESKMYKLQMRNLFNIVNTIKSDQENDSSG
uniref:Uncharacterized protein n=1 Tax=Ceratitis capitata TaxID=7213 RepID=W8CCV3_CERCA